MLAIGEDKDMSSSKSARDVCILGTKLNENKLHITHQSILVLLEGVRPPYHYMLCVSVCTSSLVMHLQ